MSHKSGHIIINRRASDSVPTLDHVTVLVEASVELQFPPGATPEQKAKKVRQVERLLDQIDHDDDAAG